MFYDTKTQEFLGANVYKVQQENGLEDTYFLDALEDTELANIGIARVREQPYPQAEEFHTIQRQEGLEGNVYQITYVQIPKTLQEAKAEVLEKINADYEEQINALLQGVPQSEILTWSTQEAEAREFLRTKDEASAPILKVLSQERKVELEALCQKAIQKAEIYRQLSSNLIGKRQALEDAITKASSLEELKEIQWKS